MEIIDLINNVFERLGENVKVITDAKIHECKAVIQPMRYKNKLYISMDIGELGFNDAECFLYLGPANPDFSGKEISSAVYTNDRAYNVSRADRIKIGDKTIYIWAVLTPRIKEGAYDVLQ